MVTTHHPITKLSYLSSSGNWYSSDVVKTFAKSFKDARKPFYGRLELNAEKSNDISNVEPGQASHCVKDFVIQDNQLFAVIETTDTKDGLILERFLREGKSVVFRTAMVSDSVKIDVLQTKRGPARKVTVMDLYSVTASIVGHVQ